MDEEEVSWIARERLEPGPPSNQWISAIIILAGAAFLVLAVMGLSPIDRTAAEETYRAGDGPLQALDASLTPGFARWISAAAAATAILSTGFAARRLLHNEAVSILVAGLVMIDPGFLVHGRLATPVMPATAASLLALALFLSPRRRWHWVAAASLAFACFLDPAHLIWGVVLGVLVIARGHIYAGPQHALTAGLQALVIPGAGMLLGIVSGDSLGPDCYVAPRAQALLMMSPIDLGSNIHWHPNPVLWFGGLAAILWLGIAAAATVLYHFRLQRLPGRLQLRLTQPLRREQGRALWLIALAVFAPTAALWIPLFAVAIGAAILEFGRDSNRFGWGVGIAIGAMALAYTVRLWPILIGASDVSDLVNGIPWATVKGCT